MNIMNSDKIGLLLLQKKISDTILDLELLHSF